MTISKALFSSNNQEWGTPQFLFHTLTRTEGPFKLDAATTEDNPLGTPYFYTKKDNALEKRWRNPTFCNPPYGRDVWKWVCKAYLESIAGNKVVMLLPARVGTRWFHKWIWQRPKVDWYPLQGRLKFQGATNSAPFDSMVVIFRP